MADIKQLEMALINADKAGDVAAARTLAAEIQRQRSMTSAPAPQASAPAMASGEGPGALEKIGRGMMDPINGGAQLLTNILPKAVVDAGNKANNWLADKTGLVWRVPEGGVDQMVRDSEREYESRRAAAGESGFDGYRTMGNIISPVNLAAAVRVPATVVGGAAAGAGLGALTPATGENFWSEKAGQVGLGAAAGGAVPALARTASVLRAGLVDPFTEAGRTKIVGRALNTAAANKEAAKTAMRTRTGATPGFSPTAGQAADDAGIASLERAARAIDPAGFGDLDKSQRGALVSAIRSVAKTPEDRAMADAARKGAAQTLYGKAFQADAMRRQLAQDAAQASSPFSGVGGGVPMPDLATPGLRELASRPSFQQAISQAKSLAADKGVTLKDPLQSLEGLHYIKLALDDMANPGAGTSLGRNANAGIQDTISSLTRELEQVAPLYGNARSAFADMSRPVNQMDIGQELYNRFVPALADNADIPFKARADGYAQALRNGDQLAQNVTGMKGASLEKIMEPEQMQLLKGVVSDSQMIGAAQNAGRGVGSDTVQKMSMSNLISQSGLPSWISGFAPLRPAGGWLKTAGDILYTKNDETMRHLLADVLKDPKRAVEAMERAGVPPSKYAEVLRMATQAGAVGAVNTP